MKRFFDTAIWDKPWYRKLTSSQKSAWAYITAKCDNVGVWIPDFEAADFFIGDTVDWQAFTEATNGNIKVLDNGKWWLVDFIEFQYGTLNPECRPHQSYISLLKKHTLWIPYKKGINTHKEKDKDKDLEKDKDKEQDNEVNLIIDYFNSKTDSNVKKTTEALRSKIRARLKEGYIVEECKSAIAWCNWKWADDEKMHDYIHIQTIFGAEKFPGYVDNFRREVPNE